MGFKDLKNLKRKDHRLFLVLILWLIVGVMIAKFIPIVVYLVFLPLLAICIVFFLDAFLLRADLKKLNFKNSLKLILIAFGIFAIFIILGMTILLSFALVLFILSIYSYIFITAFFYMHACYTNSKSLDKKLSNSPKAISFLLRWVTFLGGTFLAVSLIIFIGKRATFLASQSAISEDVQLMLGLIPFLIALLMIGLAIFGGLFVLFGKLNAWLGIFFLFVSFYVVYLIVLAIFGSGNAASSSPITSLGAIEIEKLYYDILLLVFDVILILFSVSSLIGEKADTLNSKLKFISSDAILMWLLFSKTAYIFADNVLPGANVSNLKSIGVYVLFIPLMFIMSVYGIIKYGKKKKK